MAALVLALALKGRFMNDGDACDADPAGDPDPDVRDGP